MTQLEATSDDDRGRPFQSFSRWRTIAAWFGFGVTAYAIALVETIPAALLIRDPDTLTLGGTIWRGTASLSAGHEVAWTVAPFRSLATASFAVDWTLTGPNTDIAGQGALGLFGLTVSDVSGRADTALIAALLPGLAVPCEIEARVDLRSLQWTRTGFAGDGLLRSAPASCGGPDAETGVPALLGALSSQNGTLIARVARATAPEVTVATASLAPSGRLIAALRPEAAGMFPGIPTGAPGSTPFQIETMLSLP